MGLLGGIIAKGVVTAARNSTIRAVGAATANVIATKAANKEEKDDFVIKEGKLFIKPTRSSEAYYRENAVDIAQELLGVGFESVTLKPIKKLGEWSKKRYGEIESITINGKSEFLGMKKVPVSSYIVIEYLDFKGSVSQEVYKNQERIIPGVMNSVTEKAKLAQKETNEGSYKNYCSNCGKQIMNKEARFCANCGKEL